MTGIYLELLNFGFKCLNVLGLNPLKTNSALFVFSIVNYIILTLNIIATFFTTSDMTFADFCNVTFGQVGQIYVWIRLITFIVKKEDFVNFVTDVNHFWPFKDFDRTLTDECNIILKRSKLAMHVLLWVCIFDITIFFIMACFGKPLIFQIYVPDFIPYFLYIGWFHFFLYHAVILTTGFDCVYIGSVVLLLIQIKLLNKRFNEYFEIGKTTEKNTDHLKTYVDHHNFLLRQIRKVGETYGAVLLTLIWTSMGLICLSMYVASLNDKIDETDQDKASSIQVVMAMLAVVVSIFFIYFVPSQLLSNEIEKLPDSLYLSKWFECSKSDKQSLSIILMNSQQEVVIKAGKLLPMNYKVALDMSKTIFSFYTFLKTMQDKFD